MTDQEKREKVIKGLECCMGKGQSYGMCDDCPYTTGKMVCNLGALHQGALELLKAQEPRVMTFEEVKACKVMWIEEREDGEDENGEPFEKMMSWAIPMQLEEDDPDTIAYCVGSFTGYMRSNYDYGLEWRCWTSEPTDAQREAVDWE